MSGVASAIGGLDAYEHLTGTDEFHKAADKQIARGQNDPMGIGGIPDYAAMMRTIKLVGQQRISLPVDMQVAINNAAQAQLGANQVQKSIKGGDVTRAAMQMSGDAMANAAIHSKSADRFQQAVSNDMNKANDLAMGEAKQAGANAGANLSAVDMSNLKDIAMRAQATHQQHQLQNTTTGMANDLSFANSSGIEQVRSAAQAAENAMSQAVNANNVAAWGQAMSAARTVGAAGSAGLSALANNSTSNPQGGDPNKAPGVSYGGEIGASDNTGDVEGATDVTGASFDSGEGYA